MTDREHWYLRKFSLKVKKGTSFWTDSEGNFWVPSRTSQVDSNAFYSNFAFLLCATGRTAPTASLCSSTPFEVGFGTQIKHRWRVLGAGKRKYFQRFLSKRKGKKKS